MKSIILLHVKNKSGNTTDPDNYRAIAVSNAETKIVESVLLHKVSSFSECDKYQFGFKKGHSTAMGDFTFWISLSPVSYTHLTLPTILRV